MTNDNMITKKRIIELSGIKADVIYHKAFGVDTNTFVIRLPDRRELLSTRQGIKRASIVMNYYVPPELWDSLHDNSIRHQAYYEEMFEVVFTEYGVNPEEMVFISTGVSMENLCWAKETYEELWAITFTTAGAKNNAMRIGRDKASGIERNGQFERIGTINNIIVSFINDRCTHINRLFI